MGASFLTTVVLIGSVVAGQNPPEVAEQIEVGRVALENLEYEQASEALMSALGDPRASDDELVQANLLAGVANRVLDRNVEARMNFHFVLTRAPDTGLPGGMSPKITTFYELVRREVEANRPKVVKPVVAPARDSPSLTTPAISSAAPPPAASPSLMEESEGLSVLVWSGIGVAGVSAAIAIVLVVTAGVSEALVTIPAAKWDEKATWLFAGRASLAALTVPVAGLFAGAGLVAWGLVE